MNYRSCSNSFSIWVTMRCCSFNGGKGIRVLCRALDEKPLIPMPFPPINPVNLYRLKNIIEEFCTYRNI